MDDQTEVVAGWIVESVEHLVACSVERFVAEASFVVDVDAAGTSWPFVDLDDPSRRAA